jgi:hypothetical protein
LQKLLYFHKKGEYMTEQEQYARLSVKFAKLDNDGRNSLDEYTRRLVKTGCPGGKAALAHTPEDEKPAPKGEVR